MICKLRDISINNRGYYGIGAPAVNYDRKKYIYLRITDINDDGSLNKKSCFSYGKAKRKKSFCCYFYKINNKKILS